MAWTHLGISSVLKGREWSSWTRDVAQAGEAAAWQTWGLDIHVGSARAIISVISAIIMHGGDCLLSTHDMIEVTWVVRGLGGDLVGLVATGFLFLPRVGCTPSGAQS